ncbi:MAG: class II aldolase/adducin family protein [Proteobacteria bacterium]|nr:class II aldolase/adducin family protein [Pseudomonadota bacterium]
MSAQPIRLPNAKPGIGEEEWQVRVDLAACYRLVALLNMTDLIYTHISARVPGPAEQFLINPYGMLFDEITASSLVKIDLEGKIIGDSQHGVNQAGFIIHSAVHKARRELTCVIHTHTTAGMAVSAQKHGLLPLTQHAMRFYNRIGYHDYEGIALDMDEQQRLAADLGPHKAMILRNHGLLACGETVREAFDIVYHLERACQAQIAAQAGGAELNIPSPAAAARVGTQFERPGRQASKIDWAAYLRLLDRQLPGYRD